MRAAFLEEIEEERAAFLEKEVKGELVRILKPVRPLDELMKLPPHSGAYSHPALEKAWAAAREKRQQLPGGDVPDGQNRYDLADFWVLASRVKTQNSKINAGTMRSWEGSGAV